MTDDALIAQQARRIAELEELLSAYRTASKDVALALVCVGGPLNDNVLRYSREQLTPFHRILELVESVPDAGR